MDGCDRRDEWSLVVLIPAWRSSGLGRTQGEARTGLQKHRMVTAITSGSEPGSYICPVSALHLSLTMTCVLSLKSHEQRKKSCFFFSLLFPAFCLAWWDVGLISTKCWVRSVLVLCWQGCHVLPFCSDTLPTNHVCPLKFEVSTASHSVSPSSPSVICCVTMPKPLHLPGIVGQTAGRNVSFCSPCYRVLLQRSYFLCSCCAKGVWVLRDADIPEGFAQTHLSSSRFLLGLSNSYQNQEA